MQDEAQHGGRPVPDGPARADGTAVPSGQERRTQGQCLVVVLLGQVRRAGVADHQAAGGVGRAAGGLVEDLPHGQPAARQLQARLRGRAGGQRVRADLQRRRGRASGCGQQVQDLGRRAGGVGRRPGEAEEAGVGMERVPDRAGADRRPQCGRAGGDEGGPGLPRLRPADRFGQQARGRRVGQDQVGAGVAVAPIGPGTPGGVPGDRGQRSGRHHDQPRRPAQRPPGHELHQRADGRLPGPVAQPLQAVQPLPSGWRGDGVGRVRSPEERDPGGGAGGQDRAGADVQQRKVQAGHGRVGAHQ